MPCPCNELTLGRVVPADPATRRLIAAPVPHTLQRCARGNQGREREQEREAIIHDASTATKQVAREQTNGEHGTGEGRDGQQQRVNQREGLTGAHTAPVPATKPFAVFWTGVSPVSTASIRR